MKSQTGARSRVLEVTVCKSSGLDDNDHEMPLNPQKPWFEFEFSSASFHLYDFGCVT